MIDQDRRTDLESSAVVPEGTAYLQIALPGFRALVPWHMGDLRPDGSIRTLYTAPSIPVGMAGQIPIYSLSSGKYRGSCPQAPVLPPP